MGDAQDKVWHWVYVIATKRDGRPVAPVKVGVSEQPLKRLASLQTGCPYPLVGVAGLRFQSRWMALEVEQAFHRFNSGFQTSGEWFDIEPAAAVHMLIVCLQARTEFNGLTPEIAEPLLKLSGARSYAEGVIRRLRGWNFRP